MVTAALFMLQAGQQVRLSSLDVSKMDQGRGVPRANRSFGGNPISIGGVRYSHGVGTHSLSEFRIRLNGNALRFTAKVGVDDEVGEKGSVDFQIWADGKRIWWSDHLSGGDKAIECSVSLAGAKEILLYVEDGEDGTENDHANWADAVITMKPGAAAPVAVSTGVRYEPPMRIAMRDPKPVMIHGGRVIGATPKRPFLFRVPATGVSRGAGLKGVFRVTKGSLPAGLTLHQGTGMISGSVQKAGTTRFAITARGNRGSDSREYAIVAGRYKLAQTPPMGWSASSTWGTAITAAKARSAADALLQTGLADYGYTYVNIGDGWQGSRNADGMIQPSGRFGDMPSLAAYLHKRGLKLGLTSSPGPKTCAGFEGSFGHEAKDAQQYTNWGVDYLKHDWCSYEEIAANDTFPELQKPYIAMRQALDKVDRDIVYSLSQKGMGDIFTWGKSITGGNLWRTTEDITDTWRSMESIGFSHNFKSAFTGPGGWNDPDALMVGRLGWGPQLRNSRLTPNEQITQVSMWSLLAAPLMIGGDVSSLDRFTKALLTNHEVIEVNQDPLGKGANQRIVSGKLEVWSRTLWDGTVAVGLFNRSLEKATIRADLSRLGYQSPQTVRDLWLMKNVAGKHLVIERTVPAHGAMLFKVGTPVR